MHTFAAIACLLGLGLAATPALPAIGASQSAAAPAATPASSALHALLPAEVRRSGVLRFVGDSHPPYRIVSDDRKISQGIESDLARALERVLGVTIEQHVVNSLSATLGGLEAGRYDVSMGPAVATPERQLRFDGVSWMTTRPSFVYPTDRGLQYRQLDDLCGRKISFVAGSVTERVTTRVAERCVRRGLPPAVHVPLVDNNMTLVATQAGRSDLAGMTLTAALHAAHINGDRFRVFSDDSNELGIDLLSLFVTKRSGLAPVMLAAMEALFRSGEYQQVMARWGVTAVSVPAPRLNAAK